MFIVTCPQTAAKAMEFINANEVLAYDTETTGLNTRKDTIIGFGVSNGTDGFYIPLFRYDCPTEELAAVVVSDVYTPLLQALVGKRLLMFNASFDARFTRQNLGVDLLPSLDTDVLLLKHTCDEEFPFGLKEIATKLFGLDATAEKVAMLASIKRNGGTAKQYFRADMELLAKYCVQDCLLTFRIYNYYLPRLRNERLYEFFYNDEVMPLYREVTIPMEEAGICIDVPRMRQTLSAITADLKALEAQVQNSIIPNLGLFTTWFLNKDYPQQTYTGKVPVWKKKHGTQEAAWRADAGPDAYMFNLLSKHHLKKLFFDTLGCKPLSRTPTGLPQVDEEFMDSVAESLPWVKLLIDYNKLTKLKGTYIERFLEEAEDGRFYPSFQQHRTVSGRYAGDLQQLPRPLEAGQASDVVVHYTSIIREFFVADSGCKLVSADYEQLEPSIFAHTSTDIALQEIFKAGKDFYSEVAIRTERLTNVSSDKSAPNYLGKVNKLARQKAKTYSLGIAYGMTGYKLQFEIGVTNEIADKLVKDYLAAFPALAAWMDASKDSARFDGQVCSEAGRVRHLPRAKQLFASYGARLGNSLQLWKDFNANPALYAQAKLAHKEYKNLCNNAINFKVQSLAASIVNRASINIVRLLKQQGLKARFVAQIHDEVVLNCPDAELGMVCELVKREMETVVKLSVPLRTVPQFGSNFRDCK